MAKRKGRYRQTMIGKILDRRLSNLKLKTRLTS